jgi:flavin reductase (DIM6/NTAB) family NADH-FMN oxidoreductase RutF
MRFLLTSRAIVEEFGREKEKEDIHPAECEEISEKVYSFELKKTDFIYKLLHKSRIVALNSIKTYFEQKADKCEMLEGEFIDKFKQCGFEKDECKTIDCPCIKNTEVLECDVEKENEKKNGRIGFVVKVLTARRA